MLTGIPTRLCWLILVGPRSCSPVLVRTRRHLFMLVSIVFLSPFVPACLSMFGCAGWVSPRSCLLPLPHAVSCSRCHPDPTPAPVPPVVPPFVHRPSFACAAVRLDSPVHAPARFVPPFMCLCRRSLPRCHPSPCPCCGGPAVCLGSPFMHQPSFTLCPAIRVLELLSVRACARWCFICARLAFVHARLFVRACSHLFGLLCLQNT